MGWYQTKDSTNYKLPDPYSQNDQIDMKIIIDDIPRFIAACRPTMRTKRMSEMIDLGNAGYS